MRGDYTYLDNVGPAPVLSHWIYGTAIWDSCNLRGRPKRCSECSKVLEPGSLAYRPVTNKTFRGDRICPSCMANLVPKKK